MKHISHNRLVTRISTVALARLKCVLCAPKPLKRLGRSHASLHRAEATVFMRPFAGAGLLRVVLALIVAGTLRAQPLVDTNDLSQAMESAVTAAAVSDSLSLTNDAMLPEDLAPGEGPDEPNDLANESGSTNAPGAMDSSGQYTRRPSGRESRSRRYSRQRAGQPNGSRGGSNLDGSGALGYAAFSVVADKNIFDPNRRPHAPGQMVRVTRSRDPQYFTLVGVMSYEKGTFAFFTGTSSEYQKALKSDDTIAGYKLMAISGESVRLARQTNETVMKVGMQMNLDDDGSGRLSARSASEPAIASAPRAGRSNSGASPQTPTDVPTAENDVVKRMMQRRDQE